MRLIRLKRPEPSARPHDLVVRVARREDAGAVVAMVELLSRDEGRPPPSFDREVFWRHGFGPEARFRILVAERTEPSRLVGYALFYAGFDVESASVGAHLADLWVAAEARRLGVGRALMSAVAADVRRGGGRWLTWQAWANNERAIAFYEAIGGRRVRSASFDLGPDGLDRLARGTG